MIPLRIEDNLRPPMPADPYLRDVLSVALLLILASVLIASWDMAKGNLLLMLAAHMPSSLLLAALGFLLALRCGALDLSVWAAAGLGGVVAAALINSGVGVGPAFAVAGAAGLAMGLLNGMLVGLVGLPSLLVTPATGMAVVWLLNWLIPVRQIAVPEQAFDPYFWHDSGVLAVRVTMVSAVFLAVVAALVAVDRAVWVGRKFPRRLSLLAALGASVLLAASGGAAFLIDSGLAPVPARLIGGLRVLAVRVTILSAVFLAMAGVFVATDWAVWAGRRFPRRLSLTAALAASALVAALGGAAFLIDNGLAPVPTRLIDDLRIPAAALLAGGLFLGRRGRELLAGLSLPSALLICTMWQQKAWNLPAPRLGWELQMLVLMGMVIAVHLAFGLYVEARGTGRRLPGIGVLLTVAGITAVAAAANFRYWPVHDALHLVGVAIWLAGMPAVMISFRRERRLAAMGLQLI